MNKITLLILVCTFSLLFSAEAQKSGDWTVGVNFQPFLYQKYNKSDWNNLPKSYPSSTSFNGWASGFSASYMFSDYWAIGAELDYSRQKQKYSTTSFSIQEQDKIRYIYAESAFHQLDYVKLPLYSSFKIEIGRESNFFVSLNAGIQAAFNTTYRGEFIQYAANSTMENYDLNVKILKAIEIPNEYQISLMQKDGSYANQTYKQDYIYNRFDFGILAGISLQKKILDSYVISFGVRGELGLTNIEKSSTDSSHFTFGSTVGPYYRPATHNRRLLFDFCVSKIIE